MSHRNAVQHAGLRCQTRNSVIDGVFFIGSEWKPRTRSTNSPGFASPSFCARSRAMAMGSLKSSFSTWCGTTPHMRLILRQLAALLEIETTGAAGRAELMVAADMPL